jgi:hypothetical protein
MKIQCPLAGNVSRRFQKAGHILHPWKPVKKGIDVIAPVDAMDQAVLDSP